MVQENHMQVHFDAKSVIVENFCAWKEVTI